MVNEIQQVEITLPVRGTILKWTGDNLDQLKQYADGSIIHNPVNNTVRVICANGQPRPLPMFHYLLVNNHGFWFPLAPEEINVENGWQLVGGCSVDLSTEEAT